MSTRKTGPLQFAAESGQNGVALALLKAGADTDALDDRGMTPECSAEKGGHAAVLHTFLSHKRLPPARHGQLEGSVAIIA